MGSDTGDHHQRLDLRQGLPVNTRSAGIQYIVKDVASIDALAKARRVQIDQRSGLSARACVRSVGGSGRHYHYFAEILPRTQPTHQQR